MKRVHVVSERKVREYESRIGLAFIDPDGSLGVMPDASRVSGEPHTVHPAPCAEPPPVAATLPRPAVPLP